MEENIKVNHTKDAKTALERAKLYLYRDEVNNTIFISILEERIKVPQEGNYWSILKNDEVIGFALQSPTDFQMNVSQMQENALKALTLKIKEQAINIPAFFGIEDTLKILEKIWINTFKASITPELHLQYYYLDNLKLYTSKTENIRLANLNDIEPVKGLLLNFYNEINESVYDIDDLVLRDINSGLIWVLEAQNEIVCFLRYAEQAENSIRIKNVYTSVQHRNKGYSTHLVSGFCKLKEGSTITLYTGTENSIANKVYQKIGFKHINDWAKYAINNLKNDIS
jgi:predicted GNAT family acetyltransferase